MSRPGAGAGVQVLGRACVERLWPLCVYHVGCGYGYGCVRMCVPAHACPWVQENTGVSITVKLYVYMLVCVWRGVHVKE